MIDSARNYIKYVIDTVQFFCAMVYGMNCAEIYNVVCLFEVVNYVQDVSEGKQYVCCIAGLLCLKSSWHKLFQELILINEVKCTVHVCICKKDETYIFFCYLHTLWLTRRKKRFNKNYIFLQCFKILFLRLDKKHKHNLDG